MNGECVSEALCVSSQPHEMVCCFYKSVFEWLSEMKALNSWVVAFVASSAFATLANAEILFPELQIASPTQQSELPVGSDWSDKSCINESDIRSVFVPGSLIDKSGTMAWLMAESVKGNSFVHPESVGRRVALSPIPPAGTQLRPISTFAQFAQNFRSAPQNVDHRDAVQALTSGENAPKASNVALVGLFAFSLAGTWALMGAARRGLFSVGHLSNAGLASIKHKHGLRRDGIGCLSTRC